jgi:hypothetical protein
MASVIVAPGHLAACPALVILPRSAISHRAVSNGLRRRCVRSRNAIIRSLRAHTLPPTSPAKVHLPQSLCSDSHGDGHGQIRANIGEEQRGEGLIEFRGGATKLRFGPRISWRSCHEISRPATVQHPRASAPAAGASRAYASIQPSQAARSCRPSESIGCPASITPAAARGAGTGTRGDTTQPWPLTEIWELPGGRATVGYSGG